MQQHRHQSSKSQPSRQGKAKACYNGSKKNKTDNSGDMMAKILLVEDDNNLREIYEARLQAEGFTIVAAKDGEEALVIAKKENPDLIISDVMMPRVSGFEMLDILRNTPGFKDTKVIMLTALGQAEDQARADKLGADRYLVKSQVTLEDIVNAANELLGNVAAAAPAPTLASQTPAAAPAAAPPTAPAPVVPVAVPAAPKPAEPAVEPEPVATPTSPAPSITPPVPTASVAPTTTVTQPVAVPVVAPVEPPSAPAVPTPPPVPDKPAAATTPPATPAANDAQLMANAVRDLLGPTGNQAPAAPKEETSAKPAGATPEPKPAEPAATNGTPTLKNTAAEPTLPTSTPTIPVAAPPAEPTPSAEAAPAISMPAQPVAATPVENEQAAQSQTAPTPPQQAAPTEPPSAPAVPAEPAPATETPKPEEKSGQDQDDLNDAVTIARKKVIAPISDPNAPPQDDLNTLLAKEGMADLVNQPDDSNGQMVAPHPPGHVISPTPSVPGAATPPTNNGVDPSSIAL